MAKQRKFVFGVADVVAHDVTTGDIVFVGKTLLDSSFENSISSQDIRGGRGNPLLTTYYHSAMSQLKITDAQFNLDMLARNVGSSVTTGENVWYEEQVTLNASKEGTVTKTPVASFGTNVYAWITHSADETVEKLTFNTKTFTSSTGTEGEVVTARYYTLDSAARSMTVRSDMVPSILRVVLKAMLTSPDSTANQIGELEIEVFRAIMEGSFTLSLTADGVASTPLNMRTLSSNVVDTSTGALVSTYAKIKEIITGAVWYTDVIGLSVVNGNQSLLTTTGTLTLDVRAITSTGSTFKPPYADIDFTSATVGVATVGAHTGVITGISAGTSVITATIHDKNTIETQMTVTAPA